MQTDQDEKIRRSGAVKMSYFCESTRGTVQVCEKIDFPTLLRFQYSDDSWHSFIYKPTSACYFNKTSRFCEYTCNHIYLSKCPKSQINVAEQERDQKINTTYGLFWQNKYCKNHCRPFLSKVAIVLWKMRGKFFFFVWRMREQYEFIKRLLI